MARESPLLRDYFTERDETRPGGRARSRCEYPDSGTGQRDCPVRLPGDAAAGPLPSLHPRSPQRMSAFYDHHTRHSVPQARGSLGNETIAAAHGDEEDTSTWGPASRLADIVTAPQIGGYQLPSTATETPSNPRHPAFWSRFAATTPSSGRLCILHTSLAYKELEATRASATERAPEPDTAFFSFLSTNQ